MTIFCYHVFYTHTILLTSSAGVGRTGTLITIDVELQRAMKEGMVDPFNFVAKLRGAEEPYGSN